MGASLLQRLTLEGAEVQWHRHIARALPAIRTPRRTIDAVICDIRLPDGTGEALYDTLTRFGMPPPFLFITGQGGIDQAVRLIRSGAADYITKPFDISRFLERLAIVMRPRGEMEMPPETGVSAAARRVDRQTIEAAGRDAHLLIRGSHGLGKARLARRVHDQADRRAAPFVMRDALRQPVDDAGIRAAVDESPRWHVADHRHRAADAQDAGCSDADAARARLSLNRDGWHGHRGKDCSRRISRRSVSSAAKPRNRHPAAGRPARGCGLVGDPAVPRVQCSAQGAAVWTGRHDRGRHSRA